MKRRLVWLTDIHLNHVATQHIESFLNNITAARPDAVVISGDIGEAHSLADYMMRAGRHIKRPVYFVLGNHDYYFGSIKKTRELAARLSTTVPNLYWLPRYGIVELTPTLALIGHGGWADGRLGDYARSPVMLNDYVLIRELAGLSPEARLTKLNALGDEAAAYLRRVLPDALSRYKRVFIVTHVPPFREACWHQGEISDDNFLPHFTCKAVGDVLLHFARIYPQCQVTVLCGHTHGEGETAPLNNLRVLTGGAEYGQPAIKRIFEM